jgi:hypothetical protein
MRQKSHMAWGISFSLPVFGEGRVGLFHKLGAGGPHPTSLRSATLPEVGEGEESVQPCVAA